MADILDRLNEVANFNDAQQGVRDLARTAAEEITRLRAREPEMPNGCLGRLNGYAKRFRKLVRRDEFPPLGYLSRQLAASPEPPSAWQSMESAPKDGTDVLLKVRNPARLAGFSIKIGHWAEDLSGSEQPPFRGWFEDLGSYMSGIQPDPFEWAPLPAGPLSAPAQGA